jgi:hypothetical protein
MVDKQLAKEPAVLRLVPYPEPDKFNPHPLILFLEIYFNIILPSTLRSSKWSITYKFSDQNIKCRPNYDRPRQKIVNSYADISITVIHKQTAIMTLFFNALSIINNCRLYSVMRFQVPTAASMKITAFWDTALYSLVEVDRRFS